MSVFRSIFSRNSMGIIGSLKRFDNWAKSIKLDMAAFLCGFPDVTVHTMTVIDIPHIHTIRLRYCNCARAKEADNVTQLLRNAWYPATVIEPATCVTFRTLKAYRLLNVQGNLNVTDFIVFYLFSFATFFTKFHSRSVLDNSIGSLGSGPFSLAASMQDVAMIQLESKPHNLVHALSLAGLAPTMVEICQTIGGLRIPVSSLSPHRMRFNT
ncbi:CxC2 domain-containing protein [Mycena indigotica]|uniref:CxC2 domain-containing protein n=1 Tax=Mycena indigotica TaxID=2126181 RepID=A0A8H6VP45_9AGAR|nr:CxC2 domain-containing protein [Mycena indigotica]KAF7288902.1 CxC2 domain-containing protein [Mycena indigotica]